MVFASFRKWGFRNASLQGNFFLVTKLQLGYALVLEALLRRSGCGSEPSREARLTKQSFADNCVPKLELRHKGEVSGRSPLNSQVALHRKG